MRADFRHTETMIYILHGTDASRMSMKVAALKKKHNMETVSTYDALQDPMEAVLEEMDSHSIFDEEKMIVIQNATFLSARNTTTYDLDAFVKRKDTDEIVVFCVPSEKIDQRKKAVKALAQGAQVFACIRLDQKNQPGYIREAMTEAGLKMDGEALRYFTSHVGMDALRIRSEIEKLSIYAGEVGLADVKALMVNEPIDDVFKMTDALFDQNGLLLMAYYRNFRAQNMETVAITALIASQIRFLFQVRVLMDRQLGKEEIAQTLKAHPYRVQLSMRKASRFDPDALLGWLEKLADLDQNMKSGKIDKDEGFENFALSLMMK